MPGQPPPSRAHAFAGPRRSEPVGVGRSHATLLLAVLAACNPWSDIHEAELVWHDADRIETELGITLAPLGASAPVGPWPRVVVRSDRIDFDNRAWFLSLPDAYFLDPERSFKELSAPLVVHEGLVSLQDGSLEPADRTGQLVPVLYEALQRQADEARSAGQRFGPNHDFAGHITVVAEPDTPIETLNAVLYSAGQAQHGSWMFAGRTGDKLHAALSAPPLDASAPDLGLRLRDRQGRCLVQCRLHVGHGMELASCGELPPIGSAQGCSPAELGVLDALGTLRDRCQSRWAELPEDDMPRGPAPAQGADSCIGMQLVGEGITYQEVVDEMAAAHRHHPELQQSFVYAGPSEASDAASLQAACAFVLDPGTLTEAQLDLACQPTSGLGETNPNQFVHTAAGGFALRRWMAAPDGYAEAFPEYAAWRSALALAELDTLRRTEGIRDDHHPDRRTRLPGQPQDKTPQAGSLLEPDGTTP